MLEECESGLPLNHQEQLCQDILHLEKKPVHIHLMGLSRVRLAYYYVHLQYLIIYIMFLSARHFFFGSFRTFSLFPPSRLIIVDKLKSEKNS